jgi:hypothetical protein
MANRQTGEKMNDLAKVALAWLENYKSSLEQVFTHIDYSSNTVRHIQVTELWKAIENDQLIPENHLMHIDNELYLTILHKQGIEQDHVDQLNLDKAVFKPALVCELGKEHLIVDGNHGIVRTYQLGLRSKPCYMIKQVDWERYLLHPPKEVSELFKLHVLSGQYKPKE